MPPPFTLKVLDFSADKLVGRRSAGFAITKAGELLMYIMEPMRFLQSPKRGRSKILLGGQLYPVLTPEQKIVKEEIVLEFDTTPDLNLKRKAIAALKAYLDPEGKIQKWIVNEAGAKDHHPQAP